LERQGALLEQFKGYPDALSRQAVELSSLYPATQQAALSERQLRQYWYSCTSKASKMNTLESPRTWILNAREQPIT
jgi:hypothetical protein